ncbi:MAG: DUF4258 domain-containing protein [Deltaproteobacteria bacterium]|nr:DUF4258 domain-containing protein [Deltaproteobacteria bacterium]
MTNKPDLPENPVGFINHCLRRGGVFWTYHVNMRLAGRFIARDSILKAVDAIEIVESYTDDKYLPSYLVLGRFGAGVSHVVIAVDVPGDNIRIITAYRPSSAEWLDDMKTRRPKR